jgi:hypothetical protein
MRCQVMSVFVVSYNGGSGIDAVYSFAMENSPPSKQYGKLRPCSTVHIAGNGRCRWEYRPELLVSKSLYDLICI